MRGATSAGARPVGRELASNRIGNSVRVDLADLARDAIATITTAADNDAELRVELAPAPTTGDPICSSTWCATSSTTP